MTTRTKDRIKCQCGHTGYLKCAENDQPFSKLWEKYSLDGFDGNIIEITSFDEMPDNILSAMCPKCPNCPNCGQTDKVAYDTD